jgi:conjugal transfer pilus assembly protein TrbC
MSLSLLYPFLAALLAFGDTKWAEEISSRMDPEAVAWVKEQLLKDSTIERIKKAEHLEPASTKPCFNADIPRCQNYDIAVCISCSVPDSVWVELSRELEKINGAFVLRGLPENSFRKLSEKILSLQKLGVNAPIQIDPKFFSSNQIESVPTFLILEEGKIDKISGNISIRYALQKLSEEGETQKAKHLAKLYQGDSL